MNSKRWIDDAKLELNDELISKLEFQALGIKVSTADGNLA